jgi:hypothetical protein
MLFYSCVRLLKRVLWGVISNVIKGFGFPHWTPISFHMKLSKPRYNIYVQFIHFVKQELEDCN